MSGIEPDSPADTNLDQLEVVLDRRIPIDSLDALWSAVDRKPKINPQLETVAIGIDSSVFLRLASHRNSADIVDYLDSKHLGPLILPGQAVQEFWNNQLAAVDTVAAGVKKKFETLKQDVAKVDPNFGDYAETMGSLLERFSSDYGYVYDASTLRTTIVLLELLKKKAFLSYVPRTRFNDIALNRKRTKTPPGFRDDGDGDFFVWAEFLYGLLREKGLGRAFGHAIILTHDQKIDWSRAGVAHPILAAEVKKLVDVPFDVWTIDRFYEAIAKNTSADTQIETA
jgi:hypothetical protein